MDGGQVGWHLRLGLRLIDSTHAATDEAQTRAIMGARTVEENNIKNKGSVCHWHAPALMVSGVPLRCRALLLFALSVPSVCSFFLPPWEHDTVVASFSHERSDVIKTASEGRTLRQLRKRGGINFFHNCVVFPTSHQSVCCC